MFRACIRNAKHFATAAILLLLVLLLSEAYLRTRMGPTVRTVTLATPCHLQSLLVPSATRHHEMRRLSNVTCSTGVELTTNSLGLRGHQPSIPAREGVVRILVLGDETVLAPHLPEGDTLSDRLHEFLNKSGLQVEVINAGVPGYSPLLSWLQFQHELVKLQPDIVILHFDMTDVSDDRFYRTHLKSEDDHQICCNADLESVQKHANSLVRLASASAIGRWLQQTSGVSGTNDSRNRNWLRERYEWTAASSADLRLHVKHALEPVELFRAASLKEGFQLIVSTSPVPWQTTDQESFPELSAAIATNARWPIEEDLPHRILEAMCRKSSILFCDSTPAFRTFSDPARLFENDDLTLSRFGTALYARELASLLLSPEFAELRRQSRSVH